MNTNLGRTLVAVAVVPVAMGLAQTRYTVVTLAPTGNVFTADPMDRVGINSHGVAAGSLADPALGRYRAFVTRGTDVVDLGTLDDDPSARAHGINDAGVVVGASGTASFNRGTPPFTPRRAVSYVGGNVVDLAGTGSAAYAINNAGIAVGESGGSPVVLGDGVVRSLNAPVRLMGGRARGINNENIIVGAARVLDGTRLVSRAFRWTTYGNGTDLGTLGGTTAAAEAINDSGQIVGWSANRDGETHAFLHEDGAMRDLGSLGGESRAAAINSAGQVVGYSRVGNAHRAFLYEGRTMIDLAEIAPPRDPTSRVGVGDYFYATGINDRGQVAGIGAYYTANGPPELRAFVLTPVVSVYPNIARLAAGDNLALQATSAQPVSSCQWRRNDTPIPGATAATLLIKGATEHGTAGDYVCHVTTAAGVYTSPPVPVKVRAGGESRCRIVNLSIRAIAGGPEGELIMGFAIGGSVGGARPLLIRASGPALASFGVADAMVDPALAVLRGSDIVASNDDWWNSPAGITGITAASRAVGAFAFPDLRSRDAALQHAGLPAGAYTAHVTGAAAGTVLAEIYEAPGVQSASGPDAPRLVNVSARSLVSHGDRILIAGFALGGTGSQTLLIRAVGPGLRRLGVSDALEDPKLELYRGPTLLAANDDWASDTVVRAAADSVGAFPLQGDSSKDAALLVTLGAGAYTVQVAAADGGTGTALVELYEVR